MTPPSNTKCTKRQRVSSGLMVGIHSSVTSNGEYQWVYMCVCVFIVQKAYKCDSHLVIIIIIIYCYMTQHDQRQGRNKMMDSQKRPRDPTCVLFVSTFFACCRVRGLRAIT